MTKNVIAAIPVGRIKMAVRTNFELLIIVKPVIEPHIILVI